MKQGIVIKACQRSHFASSSNKEAMQNYKGINRLFQLLSKFKRLEEVANHFIVRNEYKLN